MAGTVYFVILTNLLKSTLEVGIITALNILIWFLATFCILAQPVVNQSPIPAPLAVLKFVPELLAEEDRSGALRVLNVSILLALIIGFGVAGILFAFPALVIPLLGGTMVLPDFVRLAAIDVVVVSVGQVGLGAVIALGETKLAAQHILIWSVVRYALASILLLPLGITGVLTGWILGDLSLVYLSLRKTLHGSAGVIATASFSYSDLVRYIICNLFAALAGYVINQVDRFLTLTTQGLSHLAVYNVAITASTVAGLAPYAIITVFLPAVASLHAASKGSELHNLIRSYTRYISILVMPVAFGLAAVMEIPLRVFGPDYVSGMLPAIIVTIASGLTSVSAVYAGVLLALGKLRWYTASNMIGLAGLFVVTTVVTPIVGLSGPALGRASLMIIATFLYALAALRSRIFEIDLRAYMISVASSAIMSIVVFGALSYVHSFYTKVAGLPILIVIGAIIYLGLLRVFRLLSNDDIDFVRNVVPHSFHRFLPKIAKLAGLKHELESGEDAIS